jgi:hypothetical protein
MYTGPDWILALLNSVNKDMKVKLMLLFWRIWHHRNDNIFGNGQCPYSVSVDFLENYLFSLNFEGPTSPPADVKGKRPCSPVIDTMYQKGPKTTNERRFPWTPPPPGWIKLNVDAGFDPITRQTGLGYVARNHLSMVVFSGWTSDSFCSSVEEAENLAALIGIRKALSTFTGPIWVESDCIATVQALNCNTTNRSPSCIIVEETKEILRSFQNFKVTKCHRSANGVAHALGQISRRVFSSCFLSEAVPACVSEALDADCKLVYDEI